MINSAVLAFMSLAVSIISVRAGDSFILTGDSTTAPAGGWGDGFCGSEDAGTTSVLEDGTPCFNGAKSGATTGSFLSDGSWDSAISAIQSELDNGQKVYVTLQFGHNDQKIGDADLMATNLENMGNQLLDLGAIPVFVTPLTRRNFNDDGTVDDILQDFADATESVAEGLGVHSIDLHGKSIAYVEAIGEDDAHELNLSEDDNTHLNVNGSLLFARMVADLLQERFDDVLPIVESPELTSDIENGVFPF